MNTEIVRIGKVNSVNVERREVRVYFPGDDFMSGWLKVLKNPPIVPTTENESGGSGDASFAEHSHKISVSPWFPKINDVVLCIYETGFNGNGYVLGAL